MRRHQQNEKIKESGIYQKRDKELKINSMDWKQNRETYKEMETI